jgi:hypothetical protein
MEDATILFDKELQCAAENIVVGGGHFSENTFFIY